jgi:flavin-dependent dehydrogenase
MSWDVAVAGGGLAGAAAALRLAEAGRRVVLFEREAGAHDKVCGEFLSAEAVTELRELGVAPEGLGAAPIAAMRVAAGRTTATAALPFAAHGLSRRRLDARLLEAAAARGVAVRRGAAVRGIARDGAGIRMTTRDDDVRAGQALLATGKHDLAGWRRHGATDTIGLKIYLSLDEAEQRQVAGHVELALFRGGYAGLQLVEAGLANLCLVVSRGQFLACGRDWRRLVAAVPHLSRRLAGASVRGTRPVAVAGVPYGWLAEDMPGLPLYRLGDQAAVIPSFTGDGMAMALRSARAAAEAVRAGCPAADYQQALARSFRGPVRLAGFVVGCAATPTAQHLLAMSARAAPWLLTRLAAATRVGAPVRR